MACLDPRHDLIVKSSVQRGPRVPRIERAGGAFRSYVVDKVNVREFVRKHGPATAHVRKFQRPRRLTS
jgi:hypothetical protein